jgi:hypothetical protein
MNDEGGAYLGNPAPELVQLLSGDADGVIKKRTKKSHPAGHSGWL